MVERCGAHMHAARKREILPGAEVDAAQLGRKGLQRHREQLGREHPLQNGAQAAAPGQMAGAERKAVARIEERREEGQTDHMVEMRVAQ